MSGLSHHSGLLKSVSGAASLGLRMQGHGNMGQRDTRTWDRGTHGHGAQPGQACAVCPKQPVAPCGPFPGQPPARAFLCGAFPAGFCSVHHVGSHVV